MKKSILLSIGCLVFLFFLSSCEKPLAIGDAYQGGKIFYLDNTGKHGLISAPYDQSTAIVWNNGSNITTNALGTQIGDGVQNTQTIVTAQGLGSYAASLCYNLDLNGYSDWYLPSIGELQELYNNHDKIGNFTTIASPYLSSTESDASTAWGVNFGDGNQYVYNKSFAFYVRAIRKF